jgi:hypothetical protein
MIRESQYQTQDRFRFPTIAIASIEFKSGPSNPSNFAVIFCQSEKVPWRLRSPTATDYGT